MGEGEESTATQDDYKPTTVVVPPVKQRDESAANAKKLRDREYQRMKRAQKKRSTVASDDESVTSAAGRKPVKRARTSTHERRRLGMALICQVCREMRLTDFLVQVLSLRVNPFYAPDRGNDVLRFF
jgi:hypothetical protein